MIYRNIQCMQGCAHMMDSNSEIGFLWHHVNEIASNVGVRESAQVGWSVVPSCLTQAPPT